MVNVKAPEIDHNSKKKRVTFSVCTDKNDSYSKLSTLQSSEVSSRLSNYTDKDREHNIKTCKSTIVAHNKMGVLLTQKAKHSVNVSEVRKTLVRNVEQALLPQNILVKGRQCSPISIDIPHVKPATEAKSSYKSKYAAPELYTTLCVAKEIQETARGETKRLISADIPHATKQMLEMKILHKLNIPFEEKLYKDLVSLTICDEELIGSDDRPGFRREVEFRPCKDREPQIADFFTPSEGREYNVVEEPASYGIERIRKYNGFSLYERSRVWCRDDV